MLHTACAFDILLGKMSREKSGNGNGDDMFGPEPWTLWYKRHTRFIFICLIAAVVLIAAWYFWPRTQGDDKTNQAAQQTLQTSLASIQDGADYQQVVNITSQLIDGANEGRFNMSPSELAKLHLKKADALLNQKSYSSAVTEYQAAIKIDKTVEYVALQSEVKARYAQGERKQLIPDMQKIVFLAKQKEHTSENFNGQISNTIRQYQVEINDLQQDKPIQL